MRRSVASAAATLSARGAEALRGVGSWAPRQLGNHGSALCRSEKSPISRHLRRGFASAAAEDPTPDTDTDGRMRFASGLSNDETLSVAVAEAVAEVKATLGHDTVPSFVQLVVSADYPDPTPAAAFVAECFTRGAGEGAAPPPAIFGGVVTGCIGGRGQTMDGPSVAIVAASMPNVEVIPFTADDASLPKQVSPEQWARLMTSGDDSSSEVGASSTSTSGEGMVGGQGESVGVLALCRPDFIEIDDFTRRVHGVMPGSVVVGGAVKPGGALFAGDGALNENAAVSGIFIRGKFRMTAHSLHSCRPVGNAMTLTRAVDGHVLDLDGRSAGDVLSRMLQELPDHVSGLPVMLGVGEAPKGVGGGGGGGDSDEGGSVKREGPRPSRDVKGRVVDSDGSASGDVSGSVSGDVSGDVSGLDNTKSSSATARAKAASKIVADAQGGEYKRAELDAVKNAVDGYASGGAGFVYRDIVMADRETGGIFIGRHSLENGAPVRLHVRDNEWGRARSKELMRLVDDERKNGGGDSGAGKKKKDTGDGVELNPNPKPLRGAVMYTCVSGNRLHAANFRERVPGVELGGGYTSGELGPSAKGRQSHMHSHTSVLGLFWDS